MAEEDPAAHELTISQYGSTRWPGTSAPWQSNNRSSPQRYSHFNEDHNLSLHHHARTAPARGSSSALYYSPPGTSYTILERGHGKPSRPFASHSSTPRMAPNSMTKKRPMSPEEVLRMFGHGGRAAASNHLHPLRRSHSPASSPPSTTHRPYIQNIQDDLLVRTVTMVRPPDASHGFGICVKGGKDTDVDRVGVYISRVEEGSVAERVGLRPGDSIIEVNGTPFTAVTHEEALKMLKSCRKLSMTVRSPILPPQPPPPPPSNPSAAASAVPWLVRQTYSWMDRQGRPVSPPPEYARAAPPMIVTPRWNYSGPPRLKDKCATRKVDLNIEPGQSLGLMIRGGLEYNLGIFITGVDKDSVADRAGLMVGDQILEVNGQSFLDVTHDEAVSLLKIHKKMTVVVRDVGKVPHSCTAYDDWDNSLSVPARGSGAAIQQMIEEKARVLLNRNELNSLAYYQEEYSAKQMTIDAFVNVLLELLDTPEKHNLFTELREFVVPEDRARFDEIVYRRHPSYEYDRSFRRKAADESHILPNFHDLPASGEHLSAVRPCKIPILVESANLKEEFRTPSEDSGVGLGDARGSWTTSTSSVVCKPSSELMLSTGNCPVQEFRSEPARRRCSMESLHRLDDDGSMSGYLDGIKSHLGGWTQRVKSWYWGRPLELAHKLSRSFDMKEDQELLESSGGIRRHQSMQRLPRTDHTGDSRVDDDGLLGAMVVPDQEGNLRITVRKTKPLLGIAIEGGANTKHSLPRIINIHENGAAYESGGLEVGQLILEVDRHKVDGMQHQEVAQLIAEQFARKDRQEIEFLVVEAKKSNLEPKPTALIFLES